MSNSPDVDPAKACESLGLGAPTQNSTSSTNPNKINQNESEEEHRDGRVEAPLSVRKDLKMDSQSDFKSLEKAVSSCVGSVTRTAEYLGRQDLTFLRTTNPAAAQQLDRQAGRILSLTRRLCRSAAQDTGVRAPELSNLDAVEEDWQDVADLVDHLLEKADSCLDELKGVIKKPQPAVSGDLLGDPHGSRASPHIPNVFSNTKLPKPQKLFKNPPKLYDETAFKPLLRTKPHALVSFEESLQPRQSESQQTEYGSYPPRVLLLHIAG